MNHGGGDTKTLKKRYRLFHVDDENSDNLINYLVDCGIMPSLQPGVGMDSVEGPWSRWDPRRFSEEFLPAQHDLVEIVLGFENAFDVFQAESGDFDIVVLDVNLESFGLGSFEGLNLHGKIVKYCEETGRLRRTLAVVYTASTKVLQDFGEFVVHSVDHYRDLQRAGRTIVVRADEPDADRPGFGNMLSRICEDFVTNLSRERFLCSAEHVGVLNELRALSESFDRDRFNRLARMEVDGWEMRHLFPFQFGRLGVTELDRDARPRIASLYRLLRGSWRLRFADFCDLLEKKYDLGTPLRHIVGLSSSDEPTWERIWNEILGQSVVDQFDDIEKLHDSAKPLLELKSVVRDKDRDGLVQWVTRLRNNSTDYIVEGETQSRLSFREGKGWFFWKPDYERIREVIRLNAMRHERASGIEETSVHRNEEQYFELSYRTGNGPGIRGDFLKGLKHPHAEETRGKLAELRYVVCELYDGQVVIESSDEMGERWALQVGERGSEVARVEPRHLNGTWYVLRFPKGRW